ncbi:MAG: hypothetical protein AB1346_01375 [Thermodesulfobacteriota bacterium]
MDRTFQFGLAFRFLLILTLLFLAGVLLVFAPSFYALATTQEPEALEPAATELLVLHERIWPGLLLSFGGIFIYALVFSHRIAGPVYRIDETLRKLLRDEYPEKVTFREGDYFQPTAELLTELSAKLAGKKTKP